MCKRFVFNMPKAVLERNYGKLISGSPKAKFNISPGGKNPVRCKGDDFLTWSKWGLIPYDSVKTDDFEALSVLDITNEDVRKQYNISPSRKCFIPASGFYSWGEDKMPVYTHFKRNPHFAFAGLFESWEINQGKQVHTFLILQMPSIGKLSGNNAHMPFIMSPNESKIWLEDDEIQVFHSELFNDQDNIIVQAANKEVLDEKNDHKGLTRIDQSIDAGENLSLF